MRPEHPQWPREGGVMEFIILLATLIVFDIVALRWGYKSNDGIDSPEWERRQRWYGFH